MDEELTQDERAAREAHGDDAHLNTQPMFLTQDEDTVIVVRNVSGTLVAEFHRPWPPGSEDYVKFGEASGANGTILISPKP